MERRFEYLYTSELFHGQYAGEFDVLETVLSDTITEDDDLITMEGESCTAAHAPCPVSVCCLGVKTEGGSGVSRPVVRSPRLLTGGFPCTASTPMLEGIEVPEYSHGGYDGGVVVGFEGDWNPLKFSRLVEILEGAKDLACDAVKEGLEGFCLDLDGHEVLVSPKGGLAGGDKAKGGVIYKYRFYCQGVEFLIHSNPTSNIQPVRVRYGAESVQGHRNRFFDVHFGFVLPFLKELGLVVKTDKLSRVDMQCLIDVPMSELSGLIHRESPYMVTTLRKYSEHGSTKRVETIELGSVNNVQFCFYDKSRELRAKKSNIVKEAMFIRDCVGDEWYNSGRPITRVEIRLGRDALKALGVDSVSDLQRSEHGIVDMLTRDWLRILAEPKVRGHENTAAIHPLWNRIRTLFFQYFTGNDLEVSWNRHKQISCDADALEKQALGCLSKALAYRFGDQDKEEQSIELGNGWVERVGSRLHEKLNNCAMVVRCKSGIEFGEYSRDLDSDELRYINQLSQTKISSQRREVCHR
jgi:hypothetical protein